MREQCNHWLAQILGYCGHRATTFPITMPGERTPHVSCLQCGRAWQYHMDTMSRGETLESSAGARGPQ